MTTTLEPAATQVSRDEIDALVQRGIRNRWYAICPSAFVADAPVGLSRGGEELVVWRDANGDVHVQENRCPHRGAPLSIGNSLGDRIRCIYHGVQIGPDGVTASASGVLARRKAVS